LTERLTQTAVVGLGSSLGDRRGRIHLAVAGLAVTPGLALTGVSSLYRTAPEGRARRGFLNAAVRLETTLMPQALLGVCKAIEARLGRRPARRWADRVIDLDVLLMGDVLLRSPALEIPHPRLTERGFALIPAGEVAGDLIHPGLGVSLAEVRAPAGPPPLRWGVLGRACCGSIGAGVQPRRGPPAPPLRAAGAHR